MTTGEKLKSLLDLVSALEANRQLTFEARMAAIRADETISRLGKAAYLLLEKIEVSFMAPEEGEILLVARKEHQWHEAKVIAAYEASLQVQYLFGRWRGHSSLVPLSAEGTTWVRLPEKEAA